MSGAGKLRIACGGSEMTEPCRDLRVPTPAPEEKSKYENQRWWEQSRGEQNKAVRRRDGKTSREEHKSPTGSRQKQEEKIRSGSSTLSTKQIEDEVHEQKSEIYSIKPEHDSHIIIEKTVIPILFDYLNIKF
jgi:hypothetical protein